MLLHVSVILFTEEGRDRPQCMLDTTTSREQTPSPLGADPPSPTPGSRPPPGADTPLPTAVHAGIYGQQVGGTHPTGMHSCFLLPANVVVKVMFSQVCVSVHRGVCLSACWETPIPPARETPHQGDPPPPAKETPLSERPPPGRSPTPCQGDPPVRETPHQETLLARRPPCQGDPPTPETPLARRPSSSRPTPGGGGKLRGSGPGPQPRMKLRGIRSRPTPEGEIEGDQIQAHT